MKKLPSQYSTSELLNLLETMDETPELDQETLLEYTNDVVPFISNYKIQPGEVPVTKKLLYKLYNTFSEKPLTQSEFTMRIKEYIDDRGTAYFYINKDQFAISKHIYQESKKRDITKSLAFQKHFTWFLEEKKVEPGLKWVEGFILYYIYRDFCKERKVKPKLGYKNFHNFLKLHFKFKRVNENRSLWFRVDENIHQLLTEEEKNVIREARKKSV